MQIILLEKVHNVGDLGEVVKVRQGYARNFLIPQGKAKRATPENLKLLEEKRGELERAAADRLTQAQERAAKLEGVIGADHAKGGCRRPPVRLGDQCRHRRRAGRTRPHGREGDGAHARRSAEAHRRVSADDRAARRRRRRTSTSTFWAIRPASRPADRLLAPLHSIWGRKRPHFFGGARKLPADHSAGVARAAKRGGQLLECLCLPQVRILPHAQRSRARSAQGSAPFD